MLTTEEQDWIIHGPAWLGLRRWQGGAAAGDLARVSFQQQLNLRFMRRDSHFMPEMERLEAQLCGPFAEVLPVPCQAGMTSPARTSHVEGCAYRDNTQLRLCG